jgi:hypothetical protein
LAALLHEHDLLILEPKAEHVGVVGEVDEASGSEDTSSVARHFSTPRGQRELVQLGERILVRVVELLGLLLGVEVVQVAEERVELCPVGRCLFMSPKWFLPNWPVA